MTYILKESIKTFKSYKPNTDTYVVKLDANESNANVSLLSQKLDLSEVNRYPDNYAIKLRQTIAQFQNVSYEEVMVGAGSSELLDLVVKTFVNPGDKVLSVSPSFVMYEKYTMLANGLYETVQAKDNYETVISDLIQKSKEINPKIIFLCTPNNPTGFLLKKEEVIELIESTDSLVVVDEAYMEFSETNESVIDLINTYPNLIVNRTFSKAYAIAGARLGYFISNKELIETLFTAKTPYSVNDLTQQLGILAILDSDYLTYNIETNKIERDRVYKHLNDLGVTCFPSSGNFIYCLFNSFDLGQKLKEKKVLIRSFNNGYYRITVGNKFENDILINALKEVLK